MGNKGQRYSLTVALCLIAFTVCLRLLPHPANIAPVAAIAIFGGATLPRKMAPWLPVVAMVVSDALIGFYDYRIMLTVWCSYGVIAVMSSRFLRRLTFASGALVTVAGSTIFFLMSNFAVWVWSGMYVHSVTGLLRCYAMALPFFRNSLIGDLFYTALLFGVYTYALRVGDKRFFEPKVRA